MLPISYFHFMAIMFSVVLALFLGMCKIPMSGKSTAYKRARHTLIAGLMLVTLQFLVHKLSMFRSLGMHDYSFAVNLLFFFPASFFFSESISILLENKKEWKFDEVHKIAIILYAVSTVIIGVNLTTEGKITVLSKVACTTAYLTLMLLFNVRLLKIFRQVKKRLDNFYDYDTESLVDWMYKCTLILIFMVVFTPIFIYINNSTILSVVIIAFAFTLLYIVVSMINYGIHADLISETTENAEMNFLKHSLGNEVVEESGMVCTTDADDVQEEVMSVAGESRKEGPDRLEKDKLDVCGIEDDGEATKPVETDKAITEDKSVEEKLTKRQLEFLANLEVWKENKGYTMPGLTVVKLAKTLGTNQKYLSIYVNNTLGVSFRDWINEMRLKEAMHLMKDDPEITIEVVTQECGFASRTHFQSLFLKNTGVTPAQWRRQQQDI